MTANGKRRVVVTGVGTVNPVANDADAFYDALIEGKSGVAKLQGWDAESNPSHVAGQIKNLAIEDHLDAKEIRRTARFTQIAIIAARQALAQAGVDLKPSSNGRPDGLDVTRVGVSNGTSLGSFTDIYQQVLSGGEKHERVSPFLVPRVLPNMA